jgi:hypothetical protein
MFISTLFRVNVPLTWNNFLFIKTALKTKYFPQSVYVDFIHRSLLLPKRSCSMRLWLRSNGNYSCFLAIHLISVMSGNGINYLVRSSYIGKFRGTRTNLRMTILRTTNLRTTNLRTTILRTTNPRIS